MSRWDDDIDCVRNRTDYLDTLVTEAPPRLSHRCRDCAFFRANNYRIVDDRGRYHAAGFCRADERAFGNITRADGTCAERFLRREQF